jgi:hypothetical protein
LDIRWTPAARWALLEIPWRDATRVDAAVQRYASTGEGRLTRVYERDPRALRLHLPPYTVRLFLDPDTAILTVVWLFTER